MFLFFLFLFFLFYLQLAGLSGLPNVYLRTKKGEVFTFNINYPCALPHPFSSYAIVFPNDLQVFQGA